MKLRHKIMIFLLLVLALAAAGLGEHKVSAEDETTLYVTITEGVLNIRDKPWGEKIGRLYPEDTVTYVKQGDGWTLIACDIDDGEGWVKSEYLTACPGSEGEYQNQSGGRLRVRSMPNGKAVGWLKNGKTVTVTCWAHADDGSLWAYIGTGYVAGEFLTRVDE